MTDDEINDIWINAFAAFPDVQPLLLLLRSDTPMTPGARDLLAELLSPGDPPIDPFVLELKPNAKFDMAGILEKIAAADLYGCELAAGKSSQQAAKQAGHKYARVSGRQLYRYLHEVRRLVGRLARR